MAKVRKGDDYLSIAKRYGIDADRLAKVNKYAELNPGQTITMPRITAVGEDGMEFIYDTPGPGMQVIPHEQSMAMMRQGVRPGQGMAMGGYLNDDPYGGIDPYAPPQTSYSPPTTTTTNNNTYYDAGLNVTSQGPTTNYTPPATNTNNNNNTYYDAGLNVTSQGPTATPPPPPVIPQYPGVPNYSLPTANNNVPAYPGVPTSPPRTSLAPSNAGSFDPYGTTPAPQPTPTTPGGSYYDFGLGVSSQGPSQPVPVQPSGPARPGPAASETRPGTGGGQSLDAMQPGIADYFFGAMAGFDPFGYQWDNGILVSTGEQQIDARVPVALPGNFMEVVNSLPAEQSAEWLNYMSSLYHYDEYSDQWIVNDASEAGVLDSASGGSGGGGGGYGGYGGGGGGQGAYRNYSSAIQGLVNWRGVSFA